MLYRELALGQLEQLRDLYKEDFDIHNYDKYTFYK